MATTEELLDVFTPKIAVISASHEEDRSGGSGFDHGHPRDIVVAMLEHKLNQNRLIPITGHVYSAQNTNPSNTEISKEVYCTCWDGNIVIRATVDGSYSVILNTDPSAKK